MEIGTLLRRSHDRVPVRRHLVEPRPGRFPIDPDLLSRQLDALDTARLRDIVRGYELLNAEDAEKATRLDLATAIITAARVAASRV